MEQVLLVYLVERGRALEQELINEHTEYEGNKITIDDEQFRFHEHTAQQNTYVF